jgi:hypothetical protein
VVSRPSGATNEPGLALDREVAESCMGGPAAHADWYWWRGANGIGSRSDAADGAAAISYCGPAFSTDDAAAMTLLDAWPHDWSIRRQFGLYEVTLYRPTTDVTTDALVQPSESLPLAVCYVRLRAVGW